MCRTLWYELRSQGSVLPPAGCEKTDKQCRFEKIADVLNGITWCQIPVWMISLTWTMVAPTPKTVTAMTVASRKPSRRPICDNPENTDGQVGKADLKLKEIPGRPADGFGDRV